MRLDFMASGVIVVIATVLGAWYLATVEKCEPAPGGRELCTFVAPWARPAIFLLMGIGIATFGFSIFWPRTPRGIGLPPPPPGL